MQCQFTVDTIANLRPYQSGGKAKLGITVEITKEQIPVAIGALLGKLTDAEALAIIKREFPEHFQGEDA